MGLRLVHVRLFIGVLTLAALLAGAAGALAGSESSIQLVAMDADPTDNTATSLGHLDSCVRTEPGDEVTVDLIVDAIPSDRPFLGFQVAIEFDPAHLEVTTVDNDFLLAASGMYQPFEGLSDPLPDIDGSFTIATADLASVPPNENMESGGGVLSRVTFRAMAPGISAVAPGYNPPDVYPSLIDADNQAIEVRSIAGIKIAVGEDCPPGPPDIDRTPLATLGTTPAPTVTPTPGASPSPDPIVSPVVLPAAFPASGGRLRPGPTTLSLIGLAVFAVGAGILRGWRGRPWRR